MSVQVNGFSALRWPYLFCFILLSSCFPPLSHHPLKLHPSLFLLEEDDTFHSCDLRSHYLHLHLPVSYLSLSLRTFTLTLTSPSPPLQTNHQLTINILPQPSTPQKQNCPQCAALALFRSCRLRPNTTHGGFVGRRGRGRDRSSPCPCSAMAWGSRLRWKRRISELS
ncbi:hypothetical protein BJY04DRAFT_187593 [Aspergillus karnatakaensis]|uniref:uncharacterized protein n=1 Tax=Aspergillus karnatakaensis TaxID=1810916 RepID=UPI003CCE452D